MVSRETLGDLFDDLREPVIEQIEIAAKYSGYIDRQRDEVERAAHYEHMPLPDTLDYMAIPALSIEVRQKLDKHRPETLGQASRISGVTPAAVMVSPCSTEALLMALAQRDELVDLVVAGNDGLGRMAEFFDRLQRTHGERMVELGLA